LKGFNLPKVKGSFRTFKDAAQWEAARKGYAWRVAALGRLSIGGWSVMVRVRRHRDARSVSRIGLLIGHWGRTAFDWFFIDAKLFDNVRRSGDARGTFSVGER
jgi:hypothetical protein